MANSYPVKYTNNLMTGAPVLSGQVGKYIQLLDAILVSGFNTRTALSFSISNNIATLSFNSGHGYEVGQIVLVSGSNNTDLNTEHYVTDVTSTSISFIDIPQGLPNGSIGGTVSCKVAPQGKWQKVYSGTNLAVYRCTDVTSTRLYLRVNDTIADFATVNMYETMTGVSTGTGKSYDTYWYKSDAASADAREWNFIAENHMFYIMISTTSYYTQIHTFGDIISLKAGDAYKCWLCGENYVSSSEFTYLNNPSTSSFLARGADQTGGNVYFSTVGFGTTAQLGLGYGLYSDSVDKTMLLYQPISIMVGTQFRGVIPGVIQPINNLDKSFNKLICSNIAELPNRNIIFFVNNLFTVAFDITGPWR